MQELAAEHTEGLAVALVTSGLLQVAAEQSLRLGGGGSRRVRESEVSSTGGVYRQLIFACVLAA